MQISDPDEEVLDVRPRRLPRWAVVCAAVLAVLGVVAALSRVGNDDGAVTAAGTPPVSSSSAVKSLPAEPFDSNGSLREQVLSYVFQRAHDPAHTQDYIRSDTSTTSCTLTPPGSAPAQTIERYVVTQFPRQHVLDTQRIIDKFAGLCVLELRARDDTGSVFVIRIVAPIEDAPIVEPRVDEGSAIADGSYTRFARVTTRDGWIVTAGMSGPPDAGMAQQTLLRVARNRSLLW
jgi:hypothetical protein